MSHPTTSPLSRGRSLSEQSCWIRSAGGEAAEIGRESRKESVVKHVVRLIGGLLLGASLVSSVPMAGAAQQRSLNIGYSVPGLGFPFFAIMLDGAAAAAAEDGALSILPLDGQDKDAVQLAGCENAIARGIDGLVISPRTVDGLAGCFSAAQAAGVPVVTVDRRSPARQGSTDRVAGDARRFARHRPQRRLQSSAGRLPRHGRDRPADGQL